MGALKYHTVDAGYDVITLQLHSTTKHKNSSWKIFQQQFGPQTPYGEVTNPVYDWMTQ